MNDYQAIPQIAHPPLIGNVLDLQRDRLGLFVRIAQQCGDIGSWSFGRRPVVMLNAAPLIRTVLIDQADAFHRTPRLQRLFRRLFGNGLLTREGPAHRQQRRLVTPAFHHGRLAGYADQMADYTETLARMWQPGDVVDLVPTLSELALWISGRTLINVDLRAEAPDLRVALVTISTVATHIMSHLVAFPLSWPIPQNRRFQQAIERLEATVAHMIQERRATGIDTGDMLSMLLASRHEDGRTLTDTEIRDEALALFFAGHENTAHALAWACMLVAQHPAVEARLHAEAIEVLGGRTLTVADLPNLPYALQVFQEALRLYPPAYVITRQAIVPVDLPGGYHLPAGTPVGISPYAVHRRPDYFPDPERFDPDRFAPAEAAQIGAQTYLPFGAGPHRCIGKHFALMEGQIVLATLAQHVRFELVPDQRITPEPLITLRPRGGIRMIVHRREHARTV